jgi:glycosyltransferase involved in cell wall biosynthesis
MRTLFLAPEVFAGEGGIPRILRLYLKALCDEPDPNNRVGFIALNDPVLDDRELRSYTNASLSSWLVCSRNKRRFIRAAFKQAGIYDQILCGHVGQLPVALLAKLRRPWMRYFVVAHGIEVWGKLSLPERLALRFADRVICVSDYTRQRMMRQIKLDPKKCVVLHNALDPTFRITPGVPIAQTAPTIVTITRLSHSDRYKGVDHLIEAMPAVLKEIPDAVLRIIGRGDDLPRLQRLAAARELGKSVTFLGYVDDETMAQELANCRLFSLPSSDEGFGLVYLEAMARGRPCLGVRDGAAAEVFDERSGVFAPFGNVESIAAATIRALRTDWDEQAILDRAKHFSYARFRDELLALLHSRQAR